MTRNPPHIRGVIPPETVRLRAAAQPVVAEFVKRWAPGEGSTAVTFRLQAEVRWHARELDLEPEERAEFDAAVVAGMHQMAIALGVMPAAERDIETPSGSTIRCAASYDDAPSESARGHDSGHTMKPNP